MDDNSNEITALPKRLALLNLHGSVVTIDAMGCQVEIALRIVDQGEAYVLSMKENQPSLHRDGAELFEWLRGSHPLDQQMVLGHDVQVDGGHGGIETRQVWRTEVLEGLGAWERWPALTT